MTMETATLETQRQYELAYARQQARINLMRDQEAFASEKEKYKKILKICIVLDAVELISLGTLGWFIGLVGDYYLYKQTGQSKSGRAQKKKMIIAIIGEKIPFVNILPLRTILWVWGNKASHQATP